MAARKGDRRWMQRHLNDPYVQRAQREGYRSRAAYKLIELDQRDRFLRPAQCVVDLGAAPGGWSQVLAKRIGPKGTVVAIDLLEMEPIAGVEIIRGDFREAEDLARLIERIGDSGVDLVLSDMAPNVSGMTAVDQPRMMYLVELALDFAMQQSKPGSSLVVKAFQGEGFDVVLKELRQRYQQVKIRKPDASRAASREVYLVAKGRQVR
ncbi:23S rRNA (uridine(2552)-2'-O)-methyltransferase [Lamprobacter modestohalophilus]|uniref:Ribosomal RNA large subunit methyltransferase E n=1 Tax=Lamprobacter modestohalophilus TaxID=1064514 RepID=A0A9X0W827_9GAMM|nr:23S rRNA (uridine(2552)-2'-O)-methyltransferase RlmE [Lamprobacter modestohalophilus]MBK1618521.1 23S rRNA (uridine(2552)-2'-O)-methyltransferase [Lamprobacter modestohalophilus]MCF7996549.1 23S rRNA (uridine(2552)-2'-O)-methyltransferase RlmE [Chromatiaceae bacterium]MCF8004591.1 23S rRNA (uridine(2552)-2'-O)-methyltransferase RlmE [Chromatiaceae bacterium]MCF8014646.1 23S rRNA (uridine(2552)-2'-O)-methyltransferase RlmE [Chromatiaceae bacterium]